MTQSATSFLTEEDKVISMEAALPHDLRKLAREISSAAGTSGALQWLPLHDSGGRQPGAGRVG